VGTSAFGAAESISASATRHPGHPTLGRGRRSRVGADSSPSEARRSGTRMARRDHTRPRGRSHQGRDRLALRANPTPRPARRRPTRSDEL